MNFVKEKFKEQDIVGAEVGVSNGHHALNILQEMPNVKLLYLIDPYTYYPEWADAKVNDRLYWPEDLEIVKCEALRKVYPFKSRTKWIFKFFEECTRKEVPQPLDFIYIDGNHNCKFVLIDIELSRTLVKKGGVVAGHDYHPDKPSPDSDEVYKAISTYCKKNNVVFFHKLEYWWLIN